MLVGLRFKVCVVQFMMVLMYSKVRGRVTERVMIEHTTSCFPHGLFGFDITRRNDKTEKASDE